MGGKSRVTGVCVEMVQQSIQNSTRANSVSSALTTANLLLPHLVLFTAREKQAKHCSYRKEGG